jgi:hypothetical protein
MFSCVDEERLPHDKKPKGPVKKENNSNTKPKKRPGGKPKQVDEDLYKSVVNELDSLKKVLEDRKSNYVRKKNNYQSQFPELTKVLLIQMEKYELKRQNIPAKYLTEEFYDMYDIEYTDVRVLKFLDEKINDFIGYTSKKVKIDFTKVDSDSTNFITQ